MVSKIVWQQAGIKQPNWSKVEKLLLEKDLKRNFDCKVNMIWKEFHLEALIPSFADCWYVGQQTVLTLVIVLSKGCIWADGQL